MLYFNDAVIPTLEHSKFNRNLQFLPISEIELSIIIQNYHTKENNFQETNPSSLMKRNLWKRKLELTNRTSSKLRISHPCVTAIHDQDILKQTILEI